mmetsp:Transcript_35767/g.30062  ORF Transcript_35767/g.30062 Transcript_35767/m.30062 type:complete len:215 (+) Transcript_35767:266-910(+)
MQRQHRLDLRPQLVSVRSSHVLLRNGVHHLESRHQHGGILRFKTLHELRQQLGPVLINGEVSLANSAERLRQEWLELLRHCHAPRHDFRLDRRFIRVAQMVVVYFTRLPVLVDEIFELDGPLQTDVRWCLLSNHHTQQQKRIALLHLGRSKLRLGSLAGCWIPRHCLGQEPNEMPHVFGCRLHPCRSCPYGARLFWAPRSRPSRHRGRKSATLV